MAELVHYQFRSIAFNDLGNRGGDAHLHELLHNLEAAYGHPVGKLLHGDSFGHHHFAHNGTRLFTAASFCCHAALALTLALQRCQAAAAFVLATGFACP